MGMKIASAFVCVLLSISGCGGGSSSDTNTSGSTNPAGGGSSSGTNTGTNPDNPVGGTGGTVSGSLSYYGFIGVSERASNNDVSINGGFIRFSSGVTSAAFQAGLGALNDAPDTCEVTQSESIIINDDDDVDINIPNISVSFVSAGAIIPFTSAAGVFAELERKVVAGFTAYTLANSQTGRVPGPIPAGLTFDIPGDVFPAFPNVAVPTMMPLTGTSPTNNATVTSATVFSWDAEAGSEAVISISATGISQTLVNEIPTVSFVSVNCEVIDDGNFAFPAATQAEIDAAGVALRRGSISRTLTRLEPSSTAALVITRSSDD